MTQASKRTHRLAVAAMLSAVAAVLQFVEFSIPLIPSFVKLGISALPALLDDRTDAEARELCAVLGRCLRDADYWDWTPETLAEILGSFGAYQDA